MAIDAKKLEKFKMSQTADLINIKAHIGEVLTVIDWEFTEYNDVNDGSYHNVLALKISDGNIYRTEVGAFKDKFKKYVEYFGDEKPEDRPRIKIIGRKSKKNNDYVNFVLLDEAGNEVG